MKPWLKWLLTIVAILLILVCIFCCIYIYQYFRGASLNRSFLKMSSPEPAASPAEPESEPVQPEEPEAEPEPAEEMPAMESTVDFAALAEINEEIYAFLEIPDTTICYPVVQSGEDNLYYNTHAVDKSYYTGGSIYSQSYNAKTFEDPNTVLYGHNLRSGDMFGLLGNFADVDFFQAHPTIYIHMPDQVLQYRIFAAYPYSNEHLLLNHDFSDPAEFDDFFATIRSDYALSGNFDEDAFPVSGDRVLTLSTCYSGNRSMRFLVQAVLVETYAIQTGEDAA